MSKLHTHWHIRYVKLCGPVLLMLAAFQGEAIANLYEKQTLLNAGIVITNEDFLLDNECPQKTYSIDAAKKQLHICLLAEHAEKRRCEFSFKKLLVPDAELSLSFEFQMHVADENDKQWISYFQIHSFPDFGEQWRCPVSALEVFEGKLRMYNRWDELGISITNDGTCASKTNSISTRTLFQQVPFERDRWQQFNWTGKITHKPHGELTVSLNNNVVSHVVGPNTYNDKRIPFFKLGIYKPTSWDASKKYCVDYRNIQFAMDNQR